VTNGHARERAIHLRSQYTKFYPFSEPAPLAIIYGAFHFTKSESFKVLSQIDGPHLNANFYFGAIT